MKGKLDLDAGNRSMKYSTLIKNILIAGLAAGTLDILAAIFILAGGNATGTFKYIASGAFGKSALSGGNEMVAWGILFHYLIATSWTALYFILYPRLPILKRNKWINALVYGIIVWSLMNLVVLPMSQITQRPFTWAGVLENMAILSVCIGLPASLLAERYYRKSAGQ